MKQVLDHDYVSLGSLCPSPPESLRFWIGFTHYEQFWSRNWMRLVVLRKSDDLGYKTDIFYPIHPEQVWKALATGALAADDGE